MSILRARVRHAFKNFYQTYDLIQFAIDMAATGRVKYDWHQNIVFDEIQKVKKEDGQKIMSILNKIK